MISSSEADIPRGGFAHFEHRRPDGWTSTPCRKDDDEASSQPLVRTGGEGAHDNIKSTSCGSSCDLRAGERLQNNAHSVTNILKAVKKNILLHKSFLRSKRQVLSCYNSAEPRACPGAKTKKSKRPHMMLQ